LLPCVFHQFFRLRLAAIGTMLLSRKTSLSCCQRIRQRRHNHQRRHDHQHHREVGSMVGGTEQRSHALARQQNPVLAAHRLHALIYSQLCHQPLYPQCRVPNLGGAGHHVQGAEVADPKRHHLPHHHLPSHQPTRRPRRTASNRSLTTMATTVTARHAQLAGRGNVVTEGWPS
jgi:hypothetical protein